MLVASRRGTLRFRKGFAKNYTRLLKAQGTTKGFPDGKGSISTPEQLKYARQGKNNADERHQGDQKAPATSVRQTELASYCI